MTSDKHQLGACFDSDAAETDVHERETLPAPPPCSRSDETPLVTYLHPRELMASLASESERAITPVVDRVDLHNACTPVASLAAAVEAGSLAPRERVLLAAQSAPVASRRRAFVAVAASLLALGAGALWARAQWASQARAPRARPAALQRARGGVSAASVSAARMVPQPAPATDPAPAPAPVAARPQPAPASAPVAVPSVNAGPARRPPTDALPDEPSRQNIVDALNQLRDELDACSQGLAGTAELDLTIAHGGTVTYALVGGDFARTPQGSCIARTVRRARFEPFSKPRIRILYRMAL